MGSSSDECRHRKTKGRRKRRSDSSGGGRRRRRGGHSDAEFDSDAGGRRRRRDRQSEADGFESDGGRRRRRDRQSDAAEFDSDGGGRRRRRDRQSEAEGDSDGGRRRRRDRQSDAGAASDGSDERRRKKKKKDRRRRKDDSDEAACRTPPSAAWSEPAAGGRRRKKRGKDRLEESDASGFSLEEEQGRKRRKEKKGRKSDRVQEFSEPESEEAPVERKKPKKRRKQSRTDLSEEREPTSPLSATARRQRQFGSTHGSGQFGSGYGSGYGSGMGSVRPDALQASVHSTDLSADGTFVRARHTPSLPVASPVDGLRELLATGFAGDAQPGGACVACAGAIAMQLRQTVEFERGSADEPLQVEFVAKDDLTVMAVADTGAAARAGCVRFVGQRLAQINGEKVANCDDVRALLSQSLRVALTFYPPPRTKKSRSHRPGVMHGSRPTSPVIEAACGPSLFGSSGSVGGSAELRAAVVGHSESQGHTVYRCEFCFASKLFWVCDRRLSKLKELHDTVISMVGKKSYRALVGEAHFPPKGGLPGTTRKLDEWLKALCGSIGTTLATEALRRTVLEALTEPVDRESVVARVLEGQDTC